MPDEPTQAHAAEPTPAPAVTPQIDPVSAYHQQVAALASADLTGYVDPHFEGRDPDAEEFGTADSLQAAQAAAVAWVDEQEGCDA